MPYDKPRLSALEWVKVGIALVQGVLYSILAVLIAPFRRSYGPKGFYQHIAYALFRAVTPRFTPRALAALNPSTEDAYNSYAQSQGLHPDTITLSDGTRAHWLGDKSAQKLLVWFHGGGYVLSGMEGHYKILDRAIKEAGQAGVRLGALLLSYELSAQAQYPRQLQQATQLFHYVLHDLQKRPEDIFLGGDSAGGNLVLALLSHILHPHPQVNELILNGQLAGAVAVSPWVTFNMTAHSMSRNQERDILEVAMLKEWAVQFRGRAPHDCYMEPLHAPESWWDGLPVEEFLLLTGEGEVLVDDITQFNSQLRRTNPQVTFEITENESHNHLLLGILLGEKDSRQMELFLEWVRTVVRGVSSPV